MAVRTEELVVSAQPERLARSLNNRPLSSAARCCASAALPPFPKNRILFPEQRYFVIASATLTSRRAAERTRSCPVCCSSANARSSGSSGAISPMHRLGAARQSRTAHALGLVDSPAAVDFELGPRQVRRLQRFPDRKS